MSGGPGSGRVRVLLADDDPVFLEALRAELERWVHIEVVGVARDGAEAICLFNATQPDVALVDLAMPRGDGVEVTAEMLKVDRNVSVVIVTGSSDERILARCLGLGACGCMRKSRQMLDYVPIAVAIAAGSAAPP